MAASPPTGPPVPVGTSGIGASIQPLPPLVGLHQPENNDGVWIRFQDRKWLSAGAAVPFSAGDFVHVGEYQRFPVFQRQGAQDAVIYLPTRAGFVAPYRMK